MPAIKGALRLFNESIAIRDGLLINVPREVPRNSNTLKVAANFASNKHKNFFSAAETNLYFFIKPSYPMR